MRYVDRSLNPHIYRDIFAYHWLDQHPHDYLTLSKILWHRNIKETIDTYGSEFDESHAVVRVEEWLNSKFERSMAGKDQIVTA